MTVPSGSPCRPAASVARTVGALAIGVVLLLWFFRDVIFAGRLLSYRDSLQFYYSLFDYIQQEWEAGRVPLWNPYTNCGEPLLANPTSSVLYPLKAVFFLPVSYWARYHLYVMLHVALAAATCGWVARRWGGSLAAATLAAISYAFCGNVLFSYSNVIFLCGAAWLPLALWSGERMLRERSLRRVPGFAAVLALIALSGDIELAYVAGMLVALLALLLLWQRPSEALPAADHQLRRAGSGRNRFLLLSAAASLSFLFAAGQLLPTMSFHHESNRAERDAPASLYDVPTFLARRDDIPRRADTQEPPRWYDSMVGNPPPPANHALVTYKFSVAPWRMIEFLWPNIFGRRLPFDHAWLEAIGWTGPPWTDSLYMGLLPFLLALSAWQVRGGDARVRWLSWIALLMVVAAWGWYGPGRLFDWGDQATAARSQDPHKLTGAVGGLYWLMTIVLPGFADFRYPAKLLVPAACALSLLAAIGLDRCLAGQRRGWTWSLGVLAAISAVMALLLHSLDERFQEFLIGHRVAAARTFLPDGAALDLRLALWQSAVVATLACLALRIRPARAGGPHDPTLNSRAVNWLSSGCLLILLTALDLAAANASLVLTTNRAEWERTPHVVDALRRAAALHDPTALRPFRVYIADGLRFRRANEQVPEDDFVQQQRATLTGTQHLPYRISRLCVSGTMEFYGQKTWFDTLSIPEPRLDVQPRRSFDAWGVDYFVLPGTWGPNDPVSPMRGLHRRWPPDGPDPRFPIDPLGPPLDPALPGGEHPIPQLPSVVALSNDSAFPPAWIVHRVQPLDPIASWNRTEWFPVMVSLVYPLPGERPRDLRHEAYVEDADLVREFGSLPVEWPTEGTEPETCTVTDYAPGLMELTANLAGQGIVVLSEVYSDDWQVSVSSEGGPYLPHPLVQTNRTMCGVRLPGGRYAIRLEYRPVSFLTGMLLSGLAWGGVVIWWGGGWLKRRLRRESTSTVAASSAPGEINRGPAA